MRHKPGTCDSGDGPKNDAVVFHRRMRQVGHPSGNSSTAKWQQKGTHQRATVLPWET